MGGWVGEWVGEWVVNLRELTDDEGSQVGRELYLPSCGFSIRQRPARATGTAVATAADARSERVERDLR